MTAPSEPELVCPLCRGDLEATGPESGSRRCPPCARTYPEVAGIVDMRLSSDRYLDLDDDRAKAENLAAVAGTFPELVDAYWAMTPEVPGPLAARYAMTMVDGERRAAAWLGGSWTPLPDTTVIDVGCGTGGLTVAAARLGAVVTGVDLALRWLVVARRHCEDAGVEARLVAADGALLPFRAASFDRCFSINVVEHAADQRGLLHGCILTTRPNGHVRLVVANRFTAGPDPTTGLLGVGYLPRPAAVAYVGWRRGTRYQFQRPVSASTLRALVGLTAGVAVGPAPLPLPPRTLSPVGRWTRSSYQRLRATSVGRGLLAGVGPHLEVTRTGTH